MQDKPTFTGGNKSIGAALNKTVEALWRHGLNPAGMPGWSESADGWVPPPVFSDPAKLIFPWDLRVVSKEDSTVKIDCGTIIKDISDLRVGMTIANATDTFSPSAGDFAYIKLNGAFSSQSATLEVGSDWVSDPSAVEDDGGGGLAEFESYYYHLWSFSETPTAESISIGANLYAVRLAPPTHLLRNSAVYYDEGSRPFSIPVLIPYHKVIS
jgi:hypothetical protein